MLKLILMRHAKSDSPGSKHNDIDRPLTKRGKHDASAIALALVGGGFLPDQVLCSPARRAVDTLTLVLKAVPVKPEVIYEDALYAFGDGTPYLNVIQSQARAPTIMLVGHNPSTHNLALRMVHHGNKQSLTLLKSKFPTAAAAVISFAFGNWSEIGTAKVAEGELEVFLTPKTLARREP